MIREGKVVDAMTKKDIHKHELLCPDFLGDDNQESDDGDFPQHLETPTQHNPDNDLGVEIENTMPPELAEEYPKQEYGVGLEVSTSVITNWEGRMDR